MELHGKSVLVIGLGETGLAMTKWLHRQGARVRLADTRTVPPSLESFHQAVPGIQVTTGALPHTVFAGVDLIALSPGVSATTPAIVLSGLPVVSEIELFAWGLRDLERKGQKPGKVLGITGSNGKTTVTALTAHLLNAAGSKAIACGNISPSALDALMDALDQDALPDVWVMELSSFQLETTHFLDADAATVLNLSEDHLDRHGSMLSYAEAKRRIFQGKPVQVLNRDDDYSLGMGRCGHSIVTFGLDAPPRKGDYGIRAGKIVRGGEVLLHLADCPLQGLHNAANVMAALALCEAIGYEVAPLLSGLATFKGLAHRVEIVCQHDGVLYVDDSKGTNVGATLAAIAGMGCPVGIILGGDGKGQDFSPLMPALKAHGRAVALIGRDAPVIEAAIAGCHLPVRTFASMFDALAWLKKQVQAGDCVLLSPACASVDMYRNYAHRADDFRAAVAALTDPVSRV